MHLSNRSPEETVQTFLAASVGYRIGRAARLLAEYPEIAEHGLETALVLGDAGRVQRALAADPGLVSRRDPRTGWLALLAVCASRWHLDPARAEGPRIGEVRRRDGAGGLRTLGWLKSSPALGVNDDGGGGECHGSRDQTHESPSESATCYRSEPAIAVSAPAIAGERPRQRGETGSEGPAS